MSDEKPSWIAAFNSAWNSSNDYDFARVFADSVAERPATKQAQPTETITISRELADELASEISSLMDHYSYCSNGSDYVCEFCGNRANTNLDGVIHDKNCPAERWIKTLRGE